MKPNATPNPDGIPTNFYQSFWEKVGKDITNSILNILNMDKHQNDFNQAFVCLIPKIQNPRTLANYRPIALCNLS